MKILNIFANTVLRATLGATYFDSYPPNTSLTLTCSEPLHELFANTYFRAFFHFLKDEERIETELLGSSQSVIHTTT